MKTSRLALALSTAALLAAVPGGPALARRPRVRRVCNASTVPCPPGGYHKTIAHALRRARPGDWILVWPGVYHEKQTDRQGNFPLPSEQPMPDPCAGVPRTRWCPYAGPHSTPAPAPTCPAPAAPCVAAPAPPCAAT